MSFDRERSRELTHRRYEQFLDLFNGLFQLDGRSVLGVFDCDKNVEIFVQVLPLGLTTHLLLLTHRQM